MTAEPALGLAELLRGLRAAARLTQEELAEAARLSPRTVSDLERGINRTAHKDTAILLADALGLAEPKRSLFVAAARGRIPVTQVFADTHGKVQGASPAAAVGTLPRDTPSITGRGSEFAQLLAAMTSATASSGTVSTYVIDGMAGSGKTTLAVHAAHRLAASFPDGQFFLPLHAYTPGQRAVQPADALTSLLLTAGLDAAQIPPGVEARTARWRHYAAGKKILLVLDDAAGYDQIRPLLPGAAGSIVLITCRRRLAALEGATEISLDALSPDFAPTLGDRLRRSRGRSFVGRRTELQAFQETLRAVESAVAVLFVHGPGGIGKTALLGQFADLALRAGARVVRIDARDLHLSPEGVEAGLRQAVGSTQASPFAVLGKGPRPVLFIDTYEALVPLDDWVRERLLPRLPTSALTIIAGRQRPALGWADPAWRAVTQVLNLGKLGPQETRHFLAAEGVPEERQEQIASIAHGYPLALTLAVEAAAGDDRPVGQVLPIDVVRLLIERFVTGIPDHLHRRTLEASAITRSTTEESLRAALGVLDASRLFGWLRGLSFVAEGPFGLFPHDLVRDLLEEDLRWRDPSAYRMLRSRVREHIVYRIRNGHGLERERATRDLFFLQRSSPQFAAHFTWGDPGVGWEDCVRPDDPRHLIGLVGQAEGAASAAIAQFWLRRQPEAFRVYRRGRSDHPVAMMAWLKLDKPDRNETDADPLVASAWDYVQRVRPLRPGEHLGIARFLVDPACYQRPSQLMTTMQVRVAGAYISASRIAWSVYAYANAAHWTSLMTYIDHPPLDGVNCTIGSHTYTLFGHDWRVTSLHEWLDLLAERGIQRQSADGEPLREPQRHRLLSQDQFAEAVRRALRDLHDRRRLASNPLLETCLVRDSVERPVERLESLLEEAIDQLRLERGGDKPHRAVHRTYVHPAPSHERAAEILGLPLSTYRRHLARGVGSVTGWLWAREVSGEHD